MQEVREEIERETRAKLEAERKADQARQAERLRNLQRAEMLTDGRVPPASDMPTHVIGQRNVIEQGILKDNQSEIMKSLNEAQTQSLNNINEFVRQSIRSLNASENQSLNESAVANAIADYYIHGSSHPHRGGSVHASIDSAQMKRLTEEMIISKINNIFDEVRKDNDEFEESYIGTKKSPIYADTSMQANEASPDKKSPAKKVVI